TVPRRGYRFLAPPVFAEITSHNQDPRDTASASRVGTDLATDITTESAVVKSGSRGHVLVWAGVLVAGVLCVTGWAIWRKDSRAPKEAESSLNPNLRSDDPARRSVDPRAHEEYLQARIYWKQRTAEALSKAIDHYNLAIEIAPDYAEAY